LDPPPLGRLQQGTIGFGLTHSSTRTRALEPGDPIPENPEAVDVHSAGLIYLHLEPGYGPLRKDPRYGELVRRVGLR
jgi:hypothetical protein